MKNLWLMLLFAISNPAEADCFKAQSRFFVVDEIPVEIQVHKCPGWDKILVLLEGDEVLKFEPIPDSRTQYEVNRLQSMIESLGPDIEDLLNFFFDRVLIFE